MTHAEEQAKKIAELNTLFFSLNERGQESALNVLRSLEFAQTVVMAQNHDIVSIRNKE